MKYLKVKRVNPGYLFLLLLVACGFLYNYHEILFLRPVGIHQWRSCIGASCAVNYYYGGNFFTPQINALLADHSTSDMAVSEFPLLYYVVSLFYRLFGVNEFWFRLIQVTIGFTGLIYLFRAGYHVTRDWIYAGIIPLVIFSSPVYAFYLNSFILDVTALSLTFAGFYYFLRFRERKLLRFWLISMSLFLLAGLMKPSSLLAYFGIGAVLLVDQIGNRPSFGKIAARTRIRMLVSYLAVMALIFAWYYYARSFSQVHGGSISAVEIRPIWHMEREAIQASLESMKFWFRTGDYHLPLLLAGSLVLFFGMLPFRKKTDPFFYRLTILVFLGALSFTLLFFSDMKDHDYYQVNNLFLLVPLYLSLFLLLSVTIPRIYHAWWFKMTAVLLVAGLVLHCNHRVRYRYSVRNGIYNKSSKNLAMYDIEPFLEELGIDRSCKVYCTPDESVNISLYLCNRKGLTDYSRYSTLPLEERIRKMKEIGIEYVILGSRDPYGEAGDLNKILGEKIGQTGGTEVFKLISDD